MITSSLRDLSFKSLYSGAGLAVLAFFCILLVFLLPRRICGDDNPANGQMGEHDIGRIDGISRGDVLIDPSEHSNSEGGIIDWVCKQKASMMLNLGVAFLVLTVIRQFVIRIQAKRDRI